MTTLADLHRYEYPMLAAAVAHAYEEFGSSETDSSSVHVLYDQGASSHAKGWDQRDKAMIEYAVQQERLKIPRRGRNRHLRSRTVGHDGRGSRTGARELRNSRLQERESAVQRLNVAELIARYSLGLRFFLRNNPPPLGVMADVNRIRSAAARAPRL